MFDMLEYCFKEILDRFEYEKTQAFKGNEFALKIRNEVAAKVSNLLDDNFTVKANCGLYSWAKSPWITIIDTSFDSAQESLILQYDFNTKENEMSLSLIFKHEDVSEYASLKQFLILNIGDVNLNEFTVNENNASGIILSKKYSYNQINDKKLRGDLDSIIPVYKHLAQCFKNYFDDEPLCAIDDEYSLDMDMDKLDKKDLSYAYICEKKALKMHACKLSVSDISVQYLRDEKYENNMTSPEKFFSDKFINQIIRCDITLDEYEEILSNIKNTSKTLLSGIIAENDIDLNDLNIKDKILIYSKSFTETEYKSIGKLLGSYSFNKIRIDDRLPTPLIITSIIHELAHFLLEKILKEVLMKILKSNDTPLISSYVKILLEDSDLNYLLDEFCAHTVEGRFALYGFQDYASFKYKLNEISHLYSQDDIDYALLIANTFAYDIKDILEEYIDEDLREEIKDEFLRLNDKPEYEPLDLEIESRLDGDDFIEALALILTSGIGEAVNQQDKLSRYINNYQSYFDELE